MNLTDSLKSLSAAKSTFRRDLKCYVDSWSGPATGKDARKAVKPCVYVFVTQETEIVKIGSTHRPVCRLYHLRYAATSSYSPEDAHLGRYALLEPCDMLINRKAEQIAHKLLAPWRMPTLHRRRNRNVGEWYGADTHIAQRAVMIAVACAESGVIELDVSHVRDLINKM